MIPLPSWLGSCGVYCLGLLCVPSLSHTHAHTKSQPSHSTQSSHTTLTHQNAEAERNRHSRSTVPNFPSLSRLGLLVLSTEGPVVHMHMGHGTLHVHVHVGRLACEAADERFYRSLCGDLVLERSHRVENAGSVRAVVPSHTTCDTA